MYRKNQKIKIKLYPTQKQAEELGKLFEYIGSQKTGRVTGPIEFRSKTPTTKEYEDWQGECLPFYIKNMKIIDFDAFKFECVYDETVLIENPVQYNYILEDALYETDIE